MTPVSISAWLKPELIDLDIPNIESEIIFNHLLSLAHKANLISDLNAIKDDFTYIRKSYQMAVGDGVAIPYIRSNHISNNFICFGRTRNPIDMAASDGEPIRFVVLCGAQYHDFANHITILAKLYRLMKIRHFRLSLTQCRNPIQVIKAFELREQYEQENN